MIVQRTTRLGDEAVNPLAIVGAGLSQDPFAAASDIAAGYPNDWLGISPFVDWMTIGVWGGVLVLGGLFLWMVKV